MKMTTLEIVLIGVSVAETGISAWLYRRLRRIVELERLAYERKRLELESVMQTLPLSRNVL